MPVSRKRSCAPCRGAKARCSQTLPRCSRCVERGLLCEYVQPTSHATASPYARTPGLSKAYDIPEVASSEAATLFALENDLDPSTEQTRSSAATYAWEGEVMGYSEGYSASINHTSCLIAATMDGTDLVNSAETPNVNVAPLIDLATPTLSSSTALFVGNSYSAHKPWTHIPGSLAPEGQGTLRKRPSTTTAGCAAGIIVLGQIESYPKMLTQGLSLPPFIHSRCFQDDGHSFACQEKRSHQCLPQTLSICASLVQLFYTKTETNSAFVWKTIYAEQARLDEEFHDYDHPKLLEALQAMCIYTILQAQDHESLEKNEPKAMVGTLGKIGSRIHDECGYIVRSDTADYPLSRREWLFQESLGRTFCLLLIVECLLEVMIGRVDGHCTGYYEIPLTCSRELWEVESTPEWCRRYKESLRRRKSSRPLNVRDFLSAQSQTDARPRGDPAMEAKLADAATWCQGTDQYGMLLWMILTMKSAQGTES